MGYDRNHAIVVSGFGEYIKRAHEVAGGIFEWVSPLSPVGLNSIQSFFVPPDGSKEFWKDSDDGDARRAKLVDYLCAQEMVDFVEVQYADERHEAKVANASDFRFVAPPQWTRVPPTNPGWYWVKLRPSAVIGDEVIVPIKLREDGAMFDPTCSRGLGFDLWTGPIEAPPRQDGT